MLQTMKNILKKFIPPPTNVFNREINRSIKHSEKQTKKIAADLAKLSKTIADLVKQSDKQNAKKLSDIVNAVEQLKKENKEYKSKLMKLESDIRLVLIPISILSLETNTIKTQNKQQLETLKKLINGWTKTARTKLLSLLNLLNLISRRELTDFRLTFVRYR